MSLPVSIDSRALAAELICAIIQQKGSLASLLPPVLNRVADKDRALLQDICYGTLRHFYSLSAQLNQYLKKPLKTKDTDIFALLLIGAYQLLHCRIPAYAAINSSVAATSHFKKPWAKGVVNAVLRNIQRAKDNNNTSDRNFLTGREKYDHPEWLIDLIFQAYPDEAENIFMANNQQAPMTLRINTTQQSREVYATQLMKYEISATPTPISDVGLQLVKPQDINDLPGFAEGIVSVQDEAAQLCAPLLKTEAHMHVLDACAAPGGKSCHLLQKQPSLNLVALDIDRKRCQRIEENFKRLNLSTANILCADATDTANWWHKDCGAVLFDRILLDAPCSASGVIRRHPDIKLLRRPEDILSLTELQLSLLKSLWPILKDQGILLYATCSVFLQENDDVIEKFLLEYKDAMIDEITQNFGKKTKFGVQLLPQINGHDGFYFCRLIKQSVH